MVLHKVWTLLEDPGEGQHRNLSTVLRLVAALPSDEDSQAFDTTARRQILGAVDPAPRTNDVGYVEASVTHQATDGFPENAFYQWTIRNLVTPFRIPGNPDDPDPPGGYFLADIALPAEPGLIPPTGALPADAPVLLASDVGRGDIPDGVPAGDTPQGELAGPGSTWAAPKVTTVHAGGSSHAQIEADAIAAAAADTDVDVAEEAATRSSADATHAAREAAVHGIRDAELLPYIDQRNRWGADQYFASGIPHLDLLSVDPDAGTGGDDTAAIQEALAYSPAVRIDLPPRQLLVRGGSLVLPSNRDVLIRGHGHAATRLLATSAGDMFSGEGLIAARLASMLIDGNSQATRILAIAGACCSEFDDVWMQNPTGDGVAIDGDVSTVGAFYLTFRTCHVFGAGGKCWRFTGAGGQAVDSVHLYHCTASSGTDDYYFERCRGVLLTGCEGAGGQVGATSANGVVALATFATIVGGAFTGHTAFDIDADPDASNTSRVAVIGAAVEDPSKIRLPAGPGNAVLGARNKTGNAGIGSRLNEILRTSGVTTLYVDGAQSPRDAHFVNLGTVVDGLIEIWRETSSGRTWLAWRAGGAWVGVEGTAFA